MKKNRGLDMTTGPVLNRMITFALPIMFGLLLQQLYSTVDGIVVGNYVSSTALAAVGNCTTLAFFFTAVSTGMANGSGVVIAQAFGARRPDDMRSAEVCVLFLMLLLGGVFTLFGVTCADFCVKTILSVKEPGLQVQAAVYFRIYSAGLIFTFVYNAIASILRSVGDSKALLYFLLVSTVMNTILDLVFVVSLGWDIAGAAWATVISQIACMIVSVFYMYKRYPDFRITALRQLVPEWRIMKLCLQMGIPITLQSIFVSVGNLLLQRLVNSFGEVIAAAVTVGSRFDHYTTIPIIGMFQSVAGFSGQNTGAGRLDRVKRGAWYGAFFCTGIVLLMCVFLYFFAPQLGSLFGVSGETLDQAVRYLKTLALSVPIFAFFHPLNGAMQGAGDPLAPVVTTAVALIIRVVFAYIFADLFDMGPASCWVTYRIGWAVGFVVAMILFCRGKWANKRLVRTVAEEKKLEEQI